METQEKTEIIEKKIEEIIRKELSIDEEEHINRDSNLKDDFSADSIDLLKIERVIEKEFGFSVPDQDSRKSLTIRDFATLVENNKMN